jgi:hypothetical protein
LRLYCNRIRGAVRTGMAGPLLPHELRSPCGCGEIACARPAPMADGSGKASGLAALAPLLACALCPACLSLYAKLAGVVGAGLAISEAAHAALLATAMLVSVLVSAYRYRLTRRGWPVSLSLVGITLMTLAHILGEPTSLELLGMGALAASAVVDRFGLETMLRRRTQSASHSR